MDPIINCKETDVSTLKTSAETRTGVDKVVLLDCGQASKVTRGFPFLVLFEFSFPPFDRLLL
jgi:hypothetical protein